MEWGAHTLSQYWNHIEAPPTPAYCAAPGVLHWQLELRKLSSEREILESSLADCVTYLQVLRKKQYRNECRLSTNASMTRKKRKQTQQSNRGLRREIAIREQEQSVLLNNLQACKAKIYAAEAVSSIPCGVVSPIPPVTSGSTRFTLPEDWEPIEIGWQGWTDEATVSPFARRRNNPFIDNDIAPDDASSEQFLREALDVDTTLLLPLSRAIDGLEISVPTSQDKPPSQVLASVLSPKADVFEPHTTSAEHTKEQSRQNSYSEPQVVQRRKEAQERRATDCGTSPTHLPLHLPFRLPFGPSSQSARNHTWCHNTPRISPVQDGRGGEGHKRARASSM